MLSSASGEFNFRLSVVPDMTNESEDEHGEFGGEMLPGCDSSVKEKRYVDLHKSLKTFVNKLFKYKIIKLKNYLYLWHTCKKKILPLHVINYKTEARARLCNLITLIKEINVLWNKGMSLNCY